MERTIMHEIQERQEKIDNVLHRLDQFIVDMLPDDDDELAIAHFAAIVGLASKARLLGEWADEAKKRCEEYHTLANGNAYSASAHHRTAAPPSPPPRA